MYKKNNVTPIHYYIQGQGVLFGSDYTASMGAYGYKNLRLTRL